MNDNFELITKFFSVFEVEGMVVKHSMTKSVLTFNSVPTMYFTIEGFF